MQKPSTYIGWVVDVYAALEHRILCNTKISPERRHDSKSVVDIVDRNHHSSFTQQLFVQWYMGNARMGESMD